MRKSLQIVFVLLCIQACGKMDSDEKLQYRTQVLRDTVVVKSPNPCDEDMAHQGVVVASHVKLRSQPDLSSATNTYLTINDTLLIIDSVVVQACQWGVLKRAAIVTKYYGNELLDKNQAVRILSESNGYSQVEIDSSGYRVKGEVKTGALNRQAFQIWYKVRSAHSVGWVYHELIRIQ